MSLFTRLFVQPHQPYHLIAPHPHIRELRSARMLFSILTAITLVLAVGFLLISSTAPAGILIPWPQLLTALIWLCGAGFLFVAEQRWKPLEELRLIAVQGDHRLFADEQPQPNPEALDLPIKIAMRFSMRLPLGVGLMSIGLIDAGFLLAEWLQHLLDSSIWLWLLALTLFAGTIVAFVLVVIGLQRRIVEVRQAGIRSWVQSFGMADNGVSSILWHEARLFACYRKPGSWNKGSTLIYELSSTNQVVLWTYVQKKEPLRLREIPTIPLEDHQAQMRALCSLVAAKTGLPLYSLSKRNPDEYR